MKPSQPSQGQSAGRKPASSEPQAKGKGAGGASSQRSAQGGEKKTTGSKSSK